MYVHVAVLKEAKPHERRVALVPSVVVTEAVRGLGAPAAAA
jgi:alanine dehydrogenase